MNEIYIYTFFFFILGTIMGSFYNVVGYRLPKGISLLKPPSHCPNCNKRLTPIELIPIISYLIQLAKCKNCKKPIPIFYPIFEFLTGMLFSISFLFFGMSLELLVSLTFVSVILVLVISDIKYMIIPDELLLFGGVMLFMIRIAIGSNLLSLMIDAIVPFIVLLLVKLLGDFLFKKESLGGGDIKLMVLFGIVIGWELAILSVFMASFIALPISLIILKIHKTNIIPFGPFLGLSALIIYLSQIDIYWIIEILM